MATSCFLQLKLDATNAAKNSRILPRSQLWRQLEPNHSLSTFKEKGGATVFSEQPAAATPSMEGIFEMSSPRLQKLSFPDHFETPGGVRGM